MKKYPSPKLGVRMHFSSLEKALKIEQKNVKTGKIANNLETAGNIEKILRILDLGRFKCSTRNENWF